jgi:hypothetical protein
MRNNRGEAVTITLITLSILVGVGAFLLGATPNPVTSLLGLNKGSGKNISSKDHRSVVTEPVFVRGADGKDYVLQRTWDVSSSEDIAEQPKMTLWERFMALPRIIALLAILGIIFPPLGIWLITKIKQLKGNITQIVTGVEEARKKMSPADVAILETDLSKKTNTDTKAIVKQIKVKL